MWPVDLDNGAFREDYTVQGIDTIISWYYDVWLDNGITELQRFRMLYRTIHLNMMFFSHFILQPV